VYLLGYGLNWPEIDSLLEEFFPSPDTFKPALEPAKPPFGWVSGFCLGVGVRGLSVRLAAHLHLAGG